MKVAIIGYSGSGKSTLARKFGQFYHAEVLHLDQVHHMPGWKERDYESARKIVSDFLDEHSSWVIDGNYGKLLFERRIEEADIIIMLLFNRFSSLLRAWKRYRTYKGKSRPDMAEGCPEKMDAEFIKWILFDGRTKSTRNHYRKIKLQFPDKVIILKNQRQIDAFNDRKGLV